ncbi:MAG TPA: hypothetical protein VGB77_19820, partial [Abditibacteriaceae bacterium]
MVINTGEPLLLLSSYKPMKFFRLFAAPRVLFLFSALLACFPAQAQNEAQDIISNAAVEELAPIQRLNDLLAQAVEARDANTLKLFGVGDDWRQYPDLQAQAKITHAALQPNGALVRQQYEIAAEGAANRANAGAPIILASGTHDLWLTRLEDGSYAFTPKRWAPPTDAAEALAQAAQEEWTLNAQANNNKGAPSGLLHLVAERRGERWIALRRSRWNGILIEPDQLAQSALRAAQANTDPQDVARWLGAQMKALEARGMGTAHFVLQAGRRGWIGVGAAFDPNRQMSPESTLQVAKLRRDLAGAGYLAPQGHRDFGLALARIGLMSEAADELEKAEAMQPGLVSAGQLAQATRLRADDPQAQAAAQMQREATVGLDREHPVYIINALIKEQPQPQTPLQALRLGLEYAKLADDDQSLKYLRIAEQMVKNGALEGAAPGDVGWADVIHEHLQEREQMRGAKPRNVVRSALYTVRCTLND